jgi:hypothetical protein
MPGLRQGREGTIGTASSETVNVNRKVVGSSPFSGAKSEFRPGNDSNP